MKRALFVGVLVCLGASLAHAGLEVPTNGSNQSGIGDISGSFCDDGTYTYSVDNGATNPLIYGTDRGDTQGECGDSNNGVIQQFNWNLIPTGQHTIRIFRNGEQVDQATFNTTNIGTEFLTGASSSTTAVLNGQQVTLAWQQNQQNFVIVGFNPGTEATCAERGNPTFTCTCSGGCGNCGAGGDDGQVVPDVPCESALDICVYADRPCFIEGSFCDGSRVFVHGWTREENS